MKQNETEPNGTKRNQTEQNQTKRNAPKNFTLNISTEDLHRYIAAGIKTDYGAVIADMFTNGDGGFIVYGSGLARVEK